MIKYPVFVIIMAGGSGQRFWPQSRQKRPKQLLSLCGSASLIQTTVKRLLRFISMDNTLIVTTESITDALRTHLPEIPPSNIITEPVGRNTAPCIVLAALHAEQYGDPVMVITPADHIINDETKFTEIMQSAVKIAADYDEVITIGITPTTPETGYGYIHRGELFRGGQVYRVKRFVEKPDRATAEQYLADGNYFWNSGMFVVRVSVLLELVQWHLPNLYAKVPEMRKAILNRDCNLLRECYQSLESISIDYGIMEKANNVLMIPGDFGWDDVGSWTALEHIRDRDEDGNVVSGEYVGVDTKNCIIQGHSKLIATVGLEDLIIVETEDSILICPKERAQDVKLIINQLKKKGKTQYL